MVIIILNIFRHPKSNQTFIQANRNLNLNEEVSKTNSLP